MANRLFDKISNILFPKGMKCLLCRNELFNDTELCEDCYSTLERIDTYCERCGMLLEDGSDYCVFCKTNSKYYTFARAPFVYSKNARKIIRKFKFDKKLYFANFIAKEMIKTFKKENFKADLIVYVPMFKAKEKKRGFNQSRILAEIISKELGIPLSIENLVKVKNTKNQTALSYDKRRDNLKDAFKIKNKKEFKDKNILLVDDVLTTGSTLEEISKLLLTVSVKKIMGLTFAHTYFENSL